MRASMVPTLSSWRTTLSAVDSPRSQTMDRHPGRSRTARRREDTAEGRTQPKGGHSRREDTAEGRTQPKGGHR